MIRLNKNHNGSMSNAHSPEVRYTIPMSIFWPIILPLIYIR